MSSDHPHSLIHPPLPRSTSPSHLALTARTWKYDSKNPIRYSDALLNRMAVNFPPWAEGQEPVFPLSSVSVLFAPVLLLLLLLRGSYFPLKEKEGGREGIYCFPRRHPCPATTVYFFSAELDRYKKVSTGVDCMYLRLVRVKVAERSGQISKK